MGHRNNTSAFKMREMAWELHELLDIPKTICHSKGVGHSYQQPKKGQEILTAIVRAMVNALQREEEVNIRNFGRFVVEDRVVDSGGTIIESGGPGKITIVKKSLPHPKTKKRVIFYPSNHLLAMVNQRPDCVLSAQQRKAMKSWRSIEEDGN